MPKPVKTQPKSKRKEKLKAKTPEPPGITTTRTYWLVLMAVLAVATAVFGFMLELGPLRTAVLAVTVEVVIGVVGYLRVKPSSLPLTRRATMLFLGACFIGWGIWAAITLVLYYSPFIVGVSNSVGEQFFQVTSTAICLAGGALIGELLGKNQKVQARLFNRMD